MEKESYIAAVQKINMSEAFKQETITKLQSNEIPTLKKESKINNRKTVIARNILKTAAIFTVLLLSTATITAVASNLNVVHFFKGFFHQIETPNNNPNSGVGVTTVPVEDENKIIKEASAIVNSTTTANGLKLTARGVVGDRNTVYIAVDLETVNGKAFSSTQESSVARLSFSEIWLKINDDVLGQNCYATRVDNGDVPGKATFALRNSLALNVKIHKISLSFTNLTEPNLDKLNDLGSYKSLSDIMKELGSAAPDDFEYMGARYSTEEDRLWYHKTADQFLQELKASGANSNMEYDSYMGKLDLYMEKAILEHGGITPKYFIKRTNNQTSFCTKYPNLSISNIGVRNNQLCVKFELNNSMNFDAFRDMKVILVNKNTGNMIHGSIGAGEEVNGNDKSQSDIVNGKTISCSAQFNGIADEEELKNYYLAVGGERENTLYEGKWNLNFVLNYTDTTREYKINKNVNVDDQSRMLETITISPLSLQFQFATETEDNSRGILDTLKGVNRKVNEIKIIMKNNVEVAITEQAIYDTTITSVLPAIIDPDEIKAIEINGTRIDLTNNH